MACPPKLTPRYLSERQRMACTAKLTPRYHSEHQCTALFSQRQPRPARQLCPPLAIVSVFHMFARLTCRRGSHVSDAEISFGTSVHGLPASTDADFSERQRTACPHYDSIISCGALAYGLVSESLGPKKTFVKKVDSLGNLGCAHLEIWLVGLAKFVGGSVKLS